MSTQSPFIPYGSNIWVMSGPFYRWLLPGNVSGPPPTPFPFLVIFNYVPDAAWEICVVLLHFRDCRVLAWWLTYWLLEWLLHYTMKVCLLCGVRVAYPRTKGTVLLHRNFWNSSLSERAYSVESWHESPSCSSRHKFWTLSLPINRNIMFCLSFTFLQLILTQGLNSHNSLSSYLSKHHTEGYVVSIWKWLHVVLFSLP